MKGTNDIKIVQDGKYTSGMRNTHRKNYAKFHTLCLCHLSEPLQPQAEKINSLQY